MLASFLALAAAVSGLTADAAQPATDAPATDAPAAVGQADAFAGREQARIAFESSIRGWRYEREDGDDVLYVEGNRNIWYRAELICFGFSSDVDFALGMIPISHGGGFDRFSRVRFVDGFNRHGGTECRLNSLVELTEAEAIERRLRRAPRARAT
jgi:hypothetical protein